MKKIFNFSTAMAALVAVSFASCSSSSDSDAPDQPSGSLVTVEFRPRLKATSKATDTSFENGDVIAIAKQDMRSENAYSLVYNGTTSRFDYIDDSRKITKELGQELRYIAFYPDLDNDQCDVQAINEHTMDFMGGYTDMLFAVEETASATVVLNFTHILSKLDITIENAPSPVSKVELLNLKPKYRVDIDGDTFATGTALAAVTMRRNTTDDTYYYYVAPMNFMSTTETIGRITLANGSEVEFFAPETGYFDPGKAYTWKVDLSDAEPEFTGTIVDWQ
ncbi:MAG: fimbrillin family protein [Muribaculaceae bacterium]|nr:fimbrillin family protein [Muribaculaceae bacterium]